jgi:16S rRNA (cytidine1402-2'-O)-methyltransferase
MSLVVAAVDIGNKQDIPQRTINEIKRCDVIICEFVNSFKHMMHNLNIDVSNKTIIEFNPYISMPERVIEDIFEMQKNGKNIMIVGNEGTPLITDPGVEIVRRFRESGIEVKSIPGPSAVISAISTSGIFPHKFYFAGFMPLKSKERIEFLSNLKNRADCAIVIFEPLFTSGYQSCLDIQEVFGKETKMSLHINMTREHEQSFLSSIPECIDWIDKIINSESFAKKYYGSPGLVYVIDNWPTISQ